MSTQTTDQRRLIGWRSADYTMETDDLAKAQNWSGNIEVLPVFEGDPNTRLSAQPAAEKEALVWLSKDDAQLALFQAIQAIKLGNPTDDKMILANLREAGLWIGRYGAATVAAAPVEMSPEFTDTARAAIAWVLWHQLGGSSPVGQPLRFALGMGDHDPMPEWRIAEAKRYAEWAGATTAKFHEARASTPAAPGIDLAQFREAVGVYRDEVRAMGYADGIKDADRLLRLIDDSQNGGICCTCEGSGLIGGLLPAGGGYETEPCPDCSPKGGSDVFREYLSANAESNKHAALNSPQCADWSNGVAAGFTAALKQYDAMLAASAEVGE